MDDILRKRAVKLSFRYDGEPRKEVLDWDFQSSVKPVLATPNFDFVAEEYGICDGTETLIRRTGGEQKKLLKQSEQQSPQQSLTRESPKSKPKFKPRPKYSAEQVAVDEGPGERVRRPKPRKAKSKPSPKKREAPPKETGTSYNDLFKQRADAIEREERQKREAQVQAQKLAQQKVRGHCRVCGGTIRVSDGQVLELGESIFHPACFVCYRCKKGLSGDMFNPSPGQYYHPDCLSCFHCKTSLVGQPMGLDPNTKQVYCGLHIKASSRGEQSSTEGKRVPSAPPQQPKQKQPGKGKKLFSDPNACAGCGKKPTTTYVRAMDRMWHKDCFCCFYCGNAMTSGCIHQNQLVCATCYHEHFVDKCPVCDKPLSGAVVEYDSKKYHVECFKTTDAGKRVRIEE